MTPLPKIEPAMTPEQWADLRGGYIWCLQGNGLSATLYGDGRLMMTTPTDSDELVESRHALAALCLYQQPFGFTQEDVALLTHAANFLQGSLDLQGTAGTWDFPQEEIDGKRKTIAAYRSLASRISVLLPPSVGSSETAE